MTTKDIEQAAKAEYPETYFDGMIDRDDLYAPVKRKAFIAGANYALAQESLDEETTEQIEHILSIDSKDIVFVHAQQYLKILFDKFQSEKGGEG